MPRRDTPLSIEIPSADAERPAWTKVGIVAAAGFLVGIVWPRLTNTRIAPNPPADNGVAVLINMPFGGGGLLRKLLPRPLPGWAGEIGCTSWAQLLLKFVLANKAVTCVIPGTGKPEHMRDNAQAGLGIYPDAAMLQRMVREIAI